MNHFLDCGCCITDEGRVWCPTCADGGPRAPDRTFTVDEIRQYLEGGLFTRSEDPDGSKCIENTALLAQIHDLDDYEDGILAVTLRREYHERDNASDGPCPTKTTR